MTEAAYDAILRLPVNRFYEDAFRKATGVPLTIVPPCEPEQRRCFGRSENGFCSLAASTAAGCTACLETQVKAYRAVARQKGPQQVNCFAGLTDVAVPVVVNGRHVATLLSGQVFRREPTQRDFAMILKILGEGRDMEWEAKLRKAYFDTPVVAAERFEAIIQLLGVYAQYLADHSELLAVEVSDAEPEAVSRAKRFVKSRSDEPITLGQVVAHVRVSRFYFCKIFKRATGMTLTEYVTLVRLERVKAMLGDPSLRISEIVYAAGFGSIPRFNSVFKRHFGMPPTEYRMALRAQNPG